MNVASALAHTGKTLGGQFEFPYWCAWADIILGWVEGSRGSANGMALIENAMTAYRRTGAVQALPYALLLLAETALAVGKPKRALRAARQGWHLARQYRLDLYAAELLRVRTMAKMQLGLPPRSLLVLVSEAQHLAEKQGAVTFSARATRLRDTLSSVDG